MPICAGFPMAGFAATSPSIFLIVRCRPLPTLIRVPIWNACSDFWELLNTMQNWRDRLQATAAGYRDRIVHIKLCPDEGGLNLNMPAKAINDLSERGRIAGGIIIKHFDFSSHIFARYRITMCALQKYLNDLSNSWKQPLPQNVTGQEFIRGDKDPPHYKTRSENLRRLMFQALEQLVGLPISWQAQLRRDQSFCKDGAPRPEPLLRNQPKF
jgi:hypothetical protein